MKAFTDIKEKAHQIAWETSKDYDPLLSKEAWCEMAALDMASWLEKQGEHKPNPYFGTSFEYNGHIWGMCARDNGVDILLDKQLFKHLEKQDEQPIDKVESKFKVGDWITNGRYNRLVVGIDSRHYQFKNGDAKYIDDIDKKYHLWTIQDAKDGDVLVDEDNNIGLLKEKDDLYWHSCIYLGCDNCLRAFNVGGYHKHKNTKPATKEQRDLLFQKMADAGYEWCSEKKELSKQTKKRLRL